MAKVSRTKVKDKWKSKSWYSLRAPSLFNYAVIAYTPADNPDSIVGRVTKIPLEKLTGEQGQKNFLVKFKIDEARGNNAFTSFRGHELTSDYKRALTRRKNSRIDCNFVIDLQDSVQIRIKPIILVDKRIKKSQERILRAETHKYIKANLSKLSLSAVLKKIYSGELSKDISLTIKKTYPTKRVEISKIHVENPSSIMEVPPNEEELEKILEELENKDGKISKDEKGKESEANDDREDVDYSSMKVTELKEILKKKELPVSGTKAELIKRLQT